MRWALLLLLLGSMSWRADAQAPAPETAYEEGVAALEAGRTEVARAAFARAFEGRPDTRHGLALAATLHELGALSDAIGLYDRLLEGELGALEPERAAAIQQARRRADAGRGALTVDVSDVARVFVDGEPLGEVRPGEPRTHRLDPGVHRVVARRPDATADDAREVQVTITAGATSHVSILLGDREEPTPAAPVVLPEPPSVGGPVLLASAALPLGAGIALGVIFQSRIDEAESSSHRDAQPILQDARPIGHAATAAFVVAGVVAAVGIVWTIVSHVRD